MMDFNKIAEIAYTRGFVPRFKSMNDIGESADQINKPHEDYPLRIEQTKFCIQTLIENNETVIDERLLLEIHSHVMFGLESRGSYRKVNVRVGSYICPEWLYVPDLIKNVLPVKMEDDLKNWYTLFETIHPFEDGNGRVGGIVISALSFLKNGIYLTPMQ